MDVPAITENNDRQISHIFRWNNQSARSAKDCTTNEHSSRVYFMYERSSKEGWQSATEGVLWSCIRGWKKPFLLQVQNIVKLREETNSQFTAKLPANCIILVEANYHLSTVRDPPPLENILEDSFLYAIKRSIGLAV